MFGAHKSTDPDQLKNVFQDPDIEPEQADSRIHGTALQFATLQMNE